VEKSKTGSIASLSPSLAWSLLTKEERQLLAEYLIKVLEKEMKQKKERPLVLVNT
jgi:hypothetical protein